jgi:two-component system LytT family response regulator
VERILELTPDLVFLDVQMPGMDGFEVLRALPRDNLPCVIFLTAYEQYALQAFEFHALDYLLKPVDDERFAAAVERARNFADASTKGLMVERLLRLLGQGSEQYLSRLTIRTGSRIQLVPVEEIEWIGAAGDYVELHIPGRVHLLRETMSALQEKLDPAIFLRIHRSRIIRSACIAELRSIENHEYEVKLKDGSLHRSSRTYSDGLDDWLSRSKR